MFSKFTCAEAYRTLRYLYDRISAMHAKLAELERNGTDPDDEDAE